MALPDFLESVRIGASFLSPEVWADSSQRSADKLARSLQLADIWLTPAAVKGFSESDFVSLSAAERERLRDAVSEFRTVAAGVDAAGPATLEQVNAALPHFLTILEIVRPYIANREALDVRRAVWQALGPFRDWIPSFDYKLDWDSVGEPAVWVWLILNNDVDVMSRETQLRLATVTDAIRAKLAEAGVDRTLYVSAWKRQEVAPVVLGGARA